MPLQNQPKLSSTCMHTERISSRISFIYVKCDESFFPVMDYTEYKLLPLYVSHSEKCVTVLVITWRLLVLFMETVTIAYAVKVKLGKYMFCKFKMPVVFFVIHFLVYGLRWNKCENKKKYSWNEITEIKYSHCQIKWIK